MILWLKVSQDEFELPEIVADSPVKLARLCGVTPNCIYSTMSHAKKKFRSKYKKVKI